MLFIKLFEMCVRNVQIIRETQLKFIPLFVFAIIIAINLIESTDQTISIIFQLRSNLIWLNNVVFKFYEKATSIVLILSTYVGRSW